MKFKAYFVTIYNNIWKNRTEEGNNSVRLFKRKVRSKYPTCKLQIPSNFETLIDHKSLVK